jgi:amidase
MEGAPSISHRRLTMTRSPQSSRPSNRREFLKSGLAGSALLTAFPILSNAAGPGEPDNTPSPSNDLEEVSIADLQSRMQSGAATSRGVTEGYLARIDAIDRNGPALRSVIELNPDALAIADEMDRERKSGKVRGPLHGIPVMIKDNIDTADGMQTTAGSLALVDSKPPADAFIVTKLREAGAVLLGKTNLSEWANIRSTRSTSGWSARGGLTRNPYALDRNTSGSSSGSGAAIAASLCTVAVGTETDGSIVSPSSLNGIVGIKPTVGLVSRTGIIPISHTQDTAGPMTRTVKDAAILLTVLAGADPDDRATAGARRAPDYLEFLQHGGLKGARIGVARKYFGFHDDVDALMADAIGVLKSQGAIIVDRVSLTSFDKIGGAEETVLLTELKADMAAYLARRGGPMKTLADLIAFNEREKAAEMPYFNQELFIKAEGKGSLKGKEYLAALATCRRLSRTEGIDAALKKHRLDALIAPTDSPAWMTDFVDGDHFIGGSSTAAAVAGYPSITVPAGNVFGLPVGISFFAGAWSEPTLIRLAFSFEQATLHRRKPEYLPSINPAKHGRRS